MVARAYIFCQCRTYEAVNVVLGKVGRFHKSKVNRSLLYGPSALGTKTPDALLSLISYVNHINHKTLSALLEQYVHAHVALGAGVIANSVIQPLAR